ncbi:MAG TPA: serine O-acetyltransferase EpsC [Candidatus Kryptonia bacterium]|nr:serine O-acetyltransferase EpsC [Candidatus Kryptonia bacterium]
MSANANRPGDLEEVIDLVMASYDGSHPIDSLESAALPNRRAVIEALRHLHSVIYIGFYSTRPLDRGNLRYSLSEQLYSAHAILVEQIRRAVSYEQMCCRVGPERDAKWSEAAVLRLFRRLPELRRLLNLDVAAAFDGDPAAKNFEEIVFSYPAIHAITTHRIAHELYLEQVPMIPRIMSEEAHSRTGIDIHPGARIGERFFIDHGTGVVIGETSVIGNQVKIYQGVTLGALSVRGDNVEVLRTRKRHPTIEDGVTIYSGATILGGDTVIGAGSVIGGNVWVVESVPPGSKISYNAAQVRKG